MQRLGEFDNKVIIEQHNEPENKNVIWKDPDENKYKEYVDGSWVESEKIATPGSGGGGGDFPYKYAVLDKSIIINPSDWEYHPKTSKEDAYYSFKTKTILSDIDFDSVEHTCFGEGNPFLNDKEGYYSAGDIIFDGLDVYFYTAVSKDYKSLELKCQDIDEESYPDIFEDSATLTVNMTIVNKHYYYE